MSADNYYLIRKHPEGGFLVTCEFASIEREETTTEVLARDERNRMTRTVYATLEEAQEYAFGEYSEYGVSYDFPVKTTSLEVDR